jgi:PAS domain-containing protein
VDDLQRSGAFRFPGRRRTGVCHQSQQALGAVTETVLDNLPLLVAYVDKDQRYRFNNMAYERWFGTKPKDIYGKRLPDLLGEAAYRDIQPYVEQVLSGRPVIFERQLPYKGAGLARRDGFLPA